MLTYFWQCLICCIAIVLCSGCTVTVKEPTKQTPIQAAQSLTPSKAIIDLSKVSIGMSVDQVKSTIGDEVTVGFTVKEEGQTFPIKIKSFQKEETLNIQGFSYQILYYFTHIVHPDDQITDDETTPLVFENGVLIAKTWDDLNKIKSKP